MWLYLRRTPHLETTWHVYEKMLESKHNDRLDYDMDKYLDLIDQQIDNWTTNPHFPVLILNTDTMANKETYDLFLSFIQCRRSADATTTNQKDEQKLQALVS